MHALFALGLHPALRAFDRELRPVDRERVSAFLDDLYVRSQQPDRVGGRSTAAGPSEVGAEQRAGKRDKGLRGPGQQCRVEGLIMLGRPQGWISEQLQKAGSARGDDKAWPGGGQLTKVDRSSGPARSA